MRYFEDNNILIKNPYILMGLVGLVGVFLKVQTTPPKKKEKRRTPPAPARIS